MRCSPSPPPFSLPFWMFKKQNKTDNLLSRRHLHFISNSGSLEIDNSRKNKSSSNRAPGVVADRTCGSAAPRSRRVAWRGAGAVWERVGMRGAGARHSGCSAELEAPKLCILCTVQPWVAIFRIFPDRLSDPQNVHL